MPATPATSVSNGSLLIGNAATITVPGLITVSSPVYDPTSNVLTVGAGGLYASLAAAIGASRDGDVILVRAGTYTNDFATIRTKITIEGVGGMVNLVATIPPPNSKGILTVDNDVSIANVAFSGSAISDANGGNGAGIRYEGGQMVLENCAFTGNQDGILATPAGLPGLTNTIVIDHSLFDGNGTGTGYTHNVYIGAVDSLVFTNNISRGALVGHELKSRALINDIENNILQDGAAGNASYEIDLPNGGAGLVKNNVIEKGANAQNSIMVHFGGEGIPYAGSSLTISGNSFINDYGPNALAVLNQTAIGIAINNNTFTNLTAAEIASGPATETGNVTGAGAALPNTTLVGVLPGSTLVITDAIPHSVDLTLSLRAVQGGAGLLTVHATIGHVTAIGGSGGMIFLEFPGSGGNSISTAAGSLNSLAVLGQDLIDSEGTDAIAVGAGNITAKIGGNATVTDGSGDNQWNVTGTASFVGTGGGSTFILAGTGRLNVAGEYRYIDLQNNGGNATVDITQGGIADSITVTGGALDLKVYNGQMSVTTAAGATGTALTLGAGTVLVNSLGADVIHAGSGTATIIVSGKAEIYAGTGILALFGRGDTLGANFYGNGGTYTVDGDTGNITYYGGAKNSTVNLRLGNTTMIGGAGQMTINGGSRANLVGGSGGLVYAATDGGGANTITTASGSRNTLTLAGANVINSFGQDTIYGGSGNQTMTIHGNAVIYGSTGYSMLTLSGNDVLYGAGSDYVSVTSGAQATLFAGQSLSVNESNATVRYYASTKSTSASAVVSGGSAALQSTATGGVTITTNAGGPVQVTLGVAPATVYSSGADKIHAGSGAAAVVLTAANAEVWGGSGALNVSNYDVPVIDVQTVHGGIGAVTYSQWAGSLQFIGGTGDAVIDGGSGKLFITGGAGKMTVSGGSRGLNFTAGSGKSMLTLTAAGAVVQFGSGSTTVQELGWGNASTFNFVAGHGGGVDVINGFRPGTDKLSLQGVGVRSTQVALGSTNLQLTDGTRVTLPGVTNTAHLFG